jgi:hypothetical protein
MTKPREKKLEFNNKAYIPSRMKREGNRDFFGREVMSTVYR